MPKTVVVEIEVDDNDKTIIGEIASDLSHYTILTIGFKKPEPVYTGPIHRSTAAKDGLPDATREAVSRQL